MTNPPPREVFADHVRQLVEKHESWSGFHQFHTLTWNGKEVGTPKITVIEAMSFLSDQYPLLIRRLAKESIFGGREPYAFALLFESVSVSAAALIRADMSEAREGVSVHLADIHGRLWTAAKTLGEPGDVHVDYFHPQSPIVGGDFQVALVVAALAAGVEAHGHPRPTPAWKYN